MGTGDETVEFAVDDLVLVLLLHAVYLDGVVYGSLNNAIDSLSLSVQLLFPQSFLTLRVISI